MLSAYALHIAEFRICPERQRLTYGPTLSTYQTCLWGWLGAPGCLHAPIQPGHHHQLLFFSAPLARRQWKISGSRMGSLLSAKKSGSSGDRQCVLRDARSLHRTRAFYWHRCLLTVDIDPKSAFFHSQSLSLCHNKFRGSAILTRPVFWSTFPLPPRTCQWIPGPHQFGEFGCPRTRTCQNTWWTNTHSRTCPTCIGRGNRLCLDARLSETRLGNEEGSRGTIERTRYNFAGQIHVAGPRSSRQIVLLRPRLVHLSILLYCDLIGKPIFWWSFSLLQLRKHQHPFCSRATPDRHRRGSIVSWRPDRRLVAADLSRCWC